VKNRVTPINDTIKILIHWMIDKNNNNIRVFIVLQVFKECSYFYISVIGVVGSKQAKLAFFVHQSAFSVLKSCRILRGRHTDTDNNTFDIERKKIDTDTDNNTFDIE
jgi:hypothetical protein